MDNEAYKKALVREKSARESAEKILEEKSLELYNINKNLESLVDARTQELKKAKEAAEDSDKAKTDFLLKLSHEIRTPVTGIVGFTEMLKEQGSFSAESEEIVSGIYSCAGLLEGLMDDIYDFDLKEKSIFINVGPTKVRSIFRNIASIMSIQAVLKNITLKISVSDAIPEYVDTDGKRLTQIMLNLVNNAVKYTSKGTVSIVADYVNDEKLMMQVADTGIGMSEESLLEVFHNFLQVDANSSGLGLGLSLVKTHIELLGGRITVDSKEGDGSTFCVELPAARAQKVKTIERHEFKNIKSEPNILLVEDNMINTKILGAYLTEITKSFDHATDLTGTREFLNQNNYDLIILDYFIEGGTAIDCLRLVSPENTSVIVLSATNSKQIANDCIKNGADIFLTKPIRKDAFIENVKLLLETDH